MKTPAGTECPHFYGDYFRGRNVEECRLLKAAGERWTRDLCKTCPVPGIARANACEFMKLKPTVARPIEALFQRRVQCLLIVRKQNGMFPSRISVVGNVMPFRSSLKSNPDRPKRIVPARIKMSLTLLFDLDDTLLDTNLDAFVPAYFQALSQHLAEHSAPEYHAARAAHRDESNE